MMFLAAVMYIASVVRNDIYESVCVRSPLTPSKPGRLVLKDLDADSVVLTWSEPEFVGTHPIRFYVVSYRDTNSMTSAFLNNPRPDTAGQNPWVIAKRLSPFTFGAKCDDLEPGRVYEFKVFAGTIMGTGAASTIFVPMPKEGDQLTDEKIKQYTEGVMKVMDNGAKILKEMIEYPASMWRS